VQSTIQTKYQCTICLSLRIYYLESSSHHKNLERSVNGLFWYSDIHRCKDGMLGINNLHIDKNYAIRSFESLVLPSQKNDKPTLRGLPLPNMKRDRSIESYNITNMMPDKGFRMIIYDHSLNVELNIGRIQYDLEKPEKIIESTNKKVVMAYYPSQIILSSNLIDWFELLVNLLEELPPTSIGLFVETLRYIFRLQLINPTPFHKEIITTIIKSHQIYFKGTDTINKFQDVETRLIDEYDKPSVEIMKELVENLHNRSNYTLKMYTKTHHSDIVYIIYILLILRDEGFVEFVDNS